MNLARAVGALLFTCCFAVGSTLAVAADTGWYAGLGIGQSRARTDSDKITNDLRSLGFATAIVTSEENYKTGYKIYGGYRLDRNFAVEGGYFNLGKYSYIATTTGPPGTLVGYIEPRGLSADVLGILPVTEKFSAFARFGVQYAHSGNTFVGTGGLTVVKPYPDINSTGIKLGLGGQFDVTPSIGLRGDWERYRIRNAASSGGEINFFSAGLVFKF